MSKSLLDLYRKAYENPSQKIDIINETLKKYKENFQGVCEKSEKLKKDNSYKTTVYLIYFILLTIFS